MSKKPVFETDPIAFSALLNNLREACRMTGVDQVLLDELDPSNPLGRAHLRHMLEVLKRNVALNTPLRDPLPKNHYVLKVNRGKWPTKGQILEDFRHRTGRLENGITQRREWHPHNLRRLSRASEDETVVGYAHTVTHQQYVSNLIEEAASRGYIPGNEQELYALACHAHDGNVVPGNRITAPGSFHCSDFTHSVYHLELTFYGTTQDFETEGYRMGTNADTLFYPGESVLFVKPYATASKIVAPMIVDEKLSIRSGAKQQIIEVPYSSTNELIRELFVSKGFPSEGHLTCPPLSDEVHDRRRRFEVGFFETNSISITFNQAREELARRGYIGSLRAFAQWGQSDLAPTSGNFISVTERPQLRDSRRESMGHLTLVAAPRKEMLLPGFISAGGDNEPTRGWTFVGFREITS